MWYKSSFGDKAQFFFSSRRRHTISVSAFLLNRSSDLGASAPYFRHNLSSSKGPKPLQLKLLTTYIPKTSAFRSEERRVGKECIFRLSVNNQNKISSLQTDNVKRSGRSRNETRKCSLRR